MSSIASHDGATSDPENHNLEVVPGAPAVPDPNEHHNIHSGMTHREIALIPDPEVRALALSACLEPLLSPSGKALIEGLRPFTGFWISSMLETFEVLLRESLKPKSERRKKLRGGPSPFGSLFVEFAS